MSVVIIWSGFFILSSRLAVGVQHCVSNDTKRHWIALTHLVVHLILAVLGAKVGIEDLVGKSGTVGDRNLGLDVSEHAVGISGWNSDEQPPEKVEKEGDRLCTDERCYDSKE